MAQGAGPKGLGNEVVSGKPPAAWDLAAKRVPIKAAVGPYQAKSNARAVAAAAGKDRQLAARMQARGIV